VAAPERRLTETVTFAIPPVIFVVLFLAIDLVFACIYKRDVTDKRPEWPKEGSTDYKSEGDFKVSCMGTSNCEDFQYCLHGACCMACRAGDTMQAVGVTDFWTTVGMIGVAEFLGAILASLLIYLVPAIADEDSLNNAISVLFPCLFVGVAGVWLRQKLRSQLSGGTQQPFNDKGQACKDFLCWCACTCCTVVQEAVEVDKAEGVRVECCCKLLQNNPQVGGAVVVGAPQT